MGKKKGKAEVSEISETSAQSIPTTPEVTRENPSSQTTECPLCGESKRLTDWVGPRCYRSFTEESGKILAKTGTFQKMSDWAKTKAKEILEKTEKELKEKKEALQLLKTTISGEAFAFITERNSNVKIDIGVFKNAMREKKDELWRIKGGNRLFAQMKALERGVALLRGMIAGAEEAKAETQKTAPEVSRENSSSESTTAE